MEYFLDPFILMCLYLLNLIALYSFNLICSYSFNLICLYSFNSVCQNIHLISGTWSIHGIRRIRAWEDGASGVCFRLPLQAVRAVQRGDE